MLNDWLHACCCVWGLVYGTNGKKSKNVGEKKTCVRFYTKFYWNKIMHCFFDDNVILLEQTIVLVGMVTNICSLLTREQ